MFLPTWPIVMTMRLRSASFPFPFRTRFEHASAGRDFADNIIVIAEDGGGHAGLGEGCPRLYVTGETVASATSAIARWRAAGLEDIADRTQLERWMSVQKAEVDANPSAFAAVELALLDLFSRQAGVSLERFLGIAEPGMELRTSAVYGTGRAAKFLAQTALFQLNGMRDAKLKVSGDSGPDHRRAGLLRCSGRVRLDANNLWPQAEDAVRGLAGLARHAWAVEEPITARDWMGLVEVGRQTGLAIILDESVTRIEDLAQLMDGATYVLNARVSKHGGLLRTLAIIGEAQRLNIKVIVGAQVGETSILARAGVVAAKAAGADLVGFEGAFGTRLLARDATTVSLNFGYRGRVELAGLGALGSGLTATPEVVAACD